MSIDKVGSQHSQAPKAESKKAKSAPAPVSQEKSASEVKRGFDKHYAHEKEHLSELKHVTKGIQDALTLSKTSGTENKYKELNDEYDKREKEVDNKTVSEKEHISKNGSKTKETVQKRVDPQEGDNSYSKRVENFDKSGKNTSTDYSLINKDKDGNMIEDATGTDENGNSVKSRTKVDQKGNADVNVHEKLNQDPPESDQKRIYRETHNQMEKFHGKDKADETIHGKDKSITKKHYEKSKGEDGSIKFVEHHETAYNDKSKDTSEATTVRNPDGTYTKHYERTDSKGNKLDTTLTTNPDGSSSRKSVIIKDDGKTKIEQTEYTDPQGTKKIVSKETRPDGTVVNTEKTIEYNKTSQSANKTEGPPQKINDANLTEADKKVINAFGLNDIRPGEKKTLSAEMFSKLGPGEKGVLEADLHLGGKGEITIERSKDDPNKFILTTGAGVMAKVTGEAGEVIGTGVDAEGNRDFTGKLQLAMDFSKKGEATDTAAFLAQSALGGTAGGLASFGIEKVTEGITQQDISTPGEFIANHFKSAEISTSMGGKISGEFGKILKLKPELSAALSTGGKLEHNDDGSWTVTSSIGAKGAFNLDALFKPGVEGEVPGVKAGLEVTDNLISGTGTLSMEQSLTMDKDGRLIKDTLFKISAEGEKSSDTMKTNGVKVELGIKLSELQKLNIDPIVKGELIEAVNNGDYDKAKEIFQKSVIKDPKLELSGSVSTFEKTKGKAKVALEGKIALGGGVEAEGAYESEYTTSSYEGSVAFDRKGMTFDKDDKQTVTWEQLSQIFNGK